MNKRSSADEWWALVDNEWVKIPPDVILDTQSIDGQPYLFRSIYTKQLLCFVKPDGGI